MVLNLKYASESCWHEVCKKVVNAVVFLDDPSAECLHWHGGIARLRQSQAVGVKEFSSFENGGKVEKGVFIVSRPLAGSLRTVLKDIISSSNFKHCIVIMSSSPTSLNAATTKNVSVSSKEMEATQQLESEMLSWMRHKGSNIAEIFYLPISLVPITDHFFVLPSFKNTFPCFIEDLEGNTNYLALPRNMDLEAMPFELQIGVLHLTSCINSILSQLSVRENIYCMGVLSSLVGSQLQKYYSSALRVKTATNNASLLIIDRTVDLCNAMVYNDEVLFDKLKFTLPPFPNHSIDVSVDMSHICLANPSNNYALAPGCLHDPPTDLLDLMMSKNTKQVVFDLYKRVCFSCGLTPSALPKMDNILKILVDNFKGDYKKISANSGLLQVMLSVIQSLTSKKINSLAIMGSMQNLIYQLISADMETSNILIELTSLVAMRHQRSLDFETVFLIITFFYSFVGDKLYINPDLESNLKSEILKAAVEDKEAIGILGSSLDSFEQSIVEKHFNGIFRKLSSIKKSRSYFTKYKNVYSNTGPSQPLEYHSVISQLICDIVDIARPGIPDLKYKANILLKDSFTSRISMMINTSRPHVMDNDMIIIFIVGGTTASEVKFIRNSFKKYNKNVVVGSTSILSPSLLLKNLFIVNPLKPFE